MGFNRVSIGTQSFDPDGLKSLTREHSREQALESMRIACEEFPAVNGDLIYGWPGQTRDHWLRDLRDMVATGCGHISAYALTFEGQTPFARAERRGVIRQHADDVLFERYADARDLLAKHGYGHEEVSNWARPWQEARHNWLYWRGHYYAGIGCGAHGFLPDASLTGSRYSYESDFRKFLRQNENDPGALSDLPGISGFLAATHADIDRDRDRISWMMEYVGSSLRCREGISLKRLRDAGFDWRPCGIVNDAIKSGLLRIDNDDRMTLDAVEWFRETSWSHKVCESLITRH
jgi:oxygen-independent coproporphyrinogen-3 oxidase